MERYKKIVLIADEGTEYEMYKGENGELIIKNVIIDSDRNDKIVELENESFIIENQISEIDPPIPEGYKRITESCTEGFVVQRIKDGSEFVWIPVDEAKCEELFKINGLDRSEIVYLEDSEARKKLYGCAAYTRGYNYKDIRQSSESKHFFDIMTDELKKQKESIKKYKGFYFSRYLASKSSDGEIHFIKGEMPLVSIGINKANEMVQNFTNFENGISAHLPYGLEFDRVLEFIIESGQKDIKDVMEDSTNWGNYSSKILPTGSYEKFSTNNIYDLAGNCFQFTNERYSTKWYRTNSIWTKSCDNEAKHVIRSGYLDNNNYDINNSSSFVANRGIIVHKPGKSKYTSFRAVLTID